MVTTRSPPSAAGAGAEVDALSFLKTTFRMAGSDWAAERSTVMGSAGLRYFMRGRMCLKNLLQVAAKMTLSEKKRIVAWGFCAVAKAEMVARGFARTWVRGGRRRSWARSAWLSS